MAASGGETRRQRVRTGREGESRARRFWIMAFDFFKAKHILAKKNGFVMCLIFFLLSLPWNTKRSWRWMSQSWRGGVRSPARDHSPGRHACHDRQHVMNGGGVVEVPLPSSPIRARETRREKKQHQGPHLFLKKCKCVLRATEEQEKVHHQGDAITEREHVPSPTPAFAHLVPAHASLKSHCPPAPPTGDAPTSWSSQGLQERAEYSQGPSLPCVQW